MDRLDSLIRNCSVRRIFPIPDFSTISTSRRQRLWTKRRSWPIGYVEGITHHYVRHGTTTLFAVELETMAKANREGNLDDRLFKIILEDGTTRQRILVSELQTVVYSENLNVIQWIHKGEQH